jgi:hypothetical protein
VLRAFAAMCFAALGVPAAVAAQQPKPSPAPPGLPAPAPPPCCVITAIDARRAVVTAEESSTGHVFRFEVKTQVLLAALKVGRKIWADFATSKVTVDQAAGPCCAILPAAPPARPSSKGPAHVAT